MGDWAADLAWLICRRGVEEASQTPPSLPTKRPPAVPCPPVTAYPSFRPQLCGALKSQDENLDGPEPSVAATAASGVGNRHQAGPAEVLGRPPDCAGIPEVLLGMCWPW